MTLELLSTKDSETNELFMTGGRASPAANKDSGVEALTVMRDFPFEYPSGPQWLYPVKYQDC